VLAKLPQTIIAQLHDSDTASALGLIAVSSSPVLQLCRMLNEAGHDPATPLEAWRGDVQCLRIRAIGEASSLEINGHGTGFQSAARRGPGATGSAAGQSWGMTP
jgi:hypothetical protein